MNQFTDFANEIFQKEKKQIDFILLHPLLLVSYFFLKAVVFPIKFLIHRRPWESRRAYRCCACLRIKIHG